MRMRYYYTDPLAAAWMAKYYGMRFRVSKHGYSELSPLVEDEQLEIEDWCEDETFYIHPDSLHLLQPKEGDVISWLEHEYGRISIIENNQIILYLGDDIMTLDKDSKDIKIIRRNNTSFEWPESEKS